ncbi:DUF1453 domain-containing protein [Amycolatopsis sp. La24]|uniref:DUF1453 domain-containing protein n=1 Tax=Amycolatopsis sp. La24 TaxID=3028304 RepID=UPI0023AFAD38|nr:DUF1453 domain-containing protein [Amycolatopsis sp. La24]
MTDALIMGGILLALVLFTQVGRHRHNLLMGIMPFVSCTVIGVLYFTGGISLTAPNLTAGLAGAVVGGVAGAGLIATTRVERSPDTGRVQTWAGWPYLLIWLAVLGGRLVFVWAVENVRPFAVKVGEFLVSAHLDKDGVGLFFVLMALAMVAVRAGGVLWRSRQLEAVRDGQPVRA